MLPVSLIYICSGLGLLATGFAVLRDGESLDTVNSLVRAFKGGSQAGALGQFQLVYLAVFFAAMMGDWLQGPFVYALYESYGISREDNGNLFVAGFGSSAVFGTFVGALADKQGRKRFALLYCALYIASCMTKHFNQFAILMVGRITGGIATSLLFSVFEAWLASENASRGFGGSELGVTFSAAYFGNSIVAILAGEVGEFAAENWEATESGIFHTGRYCAPFDVSMLFLILCGFLISQLWNENYGQESRGGGEGDANFLDTVRSVLDEGSLFYCGCVCACFEASMYLFVFNWTPALTEPNTEKPPFGHIFTAFMVMCMLGSRLFSWLRQEHSLETIGKFMIPVAALCHAVPVFTENVSIRFIAFLVFETCVGIYFPTIGTLKGMVVPEATRSTIYNIYRLPMNSMVVVTLLLQLSVEQAFLCTSVLMAFASFAQYRLSICRQEQVARSPLPGSNAIAATSVGKGVLAEDSTELENLKEEATSAV
mmetsp:Transcript_69939/g.130726  ORF Transcript_69939/g.130726 Transcript_69939/m.130726 type:complete len:485 (+) Transcript_69939:78-1532(+)